MSRPQRSGGKKKDQRKGGKKSKQDEVSYLESELQARMGKPVKVVINDNVVSSLSYTGEPENKIRLHRMFLLADSKVLDALAAWCLYQDNPETEMAVNRFIEKHADLVRTSGRKPKIVTVGKFFDLQEVFAEVNTEEFANKLKVPITWGKSSGQAQCRVIRLGSYCPVRHLIRIHPHLDQKFVPDFFIKYIVFHEMLHAQLGVEMLPSGRRIVHSKEFNCREREYKHYQRAITWLKTQENIRRLVKKPKS